MAAGDFEGLDVFAEALAGDSDLEVAWEEAIVLADDDGHGNVGPACEVGGLGERDLRFVTFVLSGLGHELLRDVVEEVRVVAFDRVAMASRGVLARLL